MSGGFPDDQIAATLNRPPPAHSIFMIILYWNQGRFHDHPVLEILDLSTD
jgi:hypothetical protein